MTPRIIYLHGFASGIQSSKAQFFRARFAEAGIELRIPAMDGGDFEHLTITGQLEVVRKETAGAPSILIGSSMGGYVAALWAARDPAVQRLVLLAPAFRFASRFPDAVGTERAAWRASGYAEVFHYGEGRIRRIHHGLMEDAEQYEEEPHFPQPALIYQGIRDNVVLPEVVTGYARRHTNVRLELVDSDHELRDVLLHIWDGMRIFLTGVSALPLV